MEINNLKNSELVVELDDLIENSYSISQPPVEITNRIVKILVNRIIDPKIYNTVEQFDLLEVLYKWSWFKCDESIYFPLSRIITKISHPSNLVVILKILSNGKNILSSEQIVWLESSHYSAVRSLIMEIKNESV